MSYKASGPGNYLAGTVKDGKWTVVHFGHLEAGLHVETGQPEFEWIEDDEKFVQRVREVLASADDAVAEKELLSLPYEAEIRATVRDQAGFVAAAGELAALQSAKERILARYRDARIAENDRKIL